MTSSGPSLGRHANRPNGCPHGRTVAKIVQLGTESARARDKACRTGAPCRLRCADVLWRTRSRTARLTGLAAVLVLTAASAALAAPRAAESRKTQPPDFAAQRLDTRIHRALLGLYALDSQLHAWRDRVASLTAQTTALRHRRTELRQELRADEGTFRVAQRQLALRLRGLYEQGNVDPVAVVLGATSLGTAIQRLDDLKQVAEADRQVVVATTVARHRLLRSRLSLAAENRRLTRSLATAQLAEQRLSAAAAGRLAYVSSLRARQRLRATQVHRVVATAQAAQQKSQRMQPSTPPPPPPAGGGRKLVVSATCYDLAGRTATGMPVGWGVVAVDPSVIPLGSRLYIPGYGKGVAADVGAGIRGRIIDLWFPTYARCAVWGRRTVTITIY
jgi:3D (Asp-Asp-Asp) domain-containing protein